MDVDRKRTVVKLGGSLFDSPSWPDRFQKWLARQTAGCYFVVVGGGKLIDVLRELDANQRLSQTEMHWRCIRALDATFEIASELIPEFGRIASNEQLNQTIEATCDSESVRAHWVRIGAYYSKELSPAFQDEPELAQSWDTTSDSLALLLAFRIRAARCFLLKSCEVKHLSTLQKAIAEGVVDAESIRFDSRIPSIEFVQI
jgi:5-(aminomethyl)-3-furanmethanol phosphate kinase